MRADNYDRNQGKVKKMLWILSSVIAFLLLFIAYFFVVQPQFNKYVYEKQIEGANYVYMDILTKVQQQGYYAIPVGNETLVLVPYNPEVENMATQN